jgi:hypothetical protein
VYEFTDASGAMYVAEPPAGVQLAALLAQALGRALRSPLPLPLEPLLACPAGQLPALRAALLPAAPDSSSARPPCCQTSAQPLACCTTLPSASGPMDCVYDLNEAVNFLNTM